MGDETIEAAVDKIEYAINRLSDASAGCMGASYSEAKAAVRQAILEAADAIRAEPVEAIPPPEVLPMTVETLRAVTRESQGADLGRDAVLAVPGKRAVVDALERLGVLQEWDGPSRWRLTRFGRMVADAIAVDDEAWSDCVRARLEWGDNGPQDVFYRTCHSLLRDWLEREIDRNMGWVGT